MPSTPSSTPSDETPRRSGRGRWILAALAAVVVLTVGAITWIAVSGGGDDGSGATRVSQQPADARDGGPQVGDRVPDFTATTLDGRTVKLSDYAGRPVVLNFWASWCAACRDEFPLLRRASPRADGDYVLLGVDNRDIASDARSFAKQQHARWPIAFDASGAIYRAYGVTGLPQTFFIDADGTVAARYYQEIPNRAKLDAALAQVTASTAATTATTSTATPSR